MNKRDLTQAIGRTLRDAGYPVGYAQTSWPINDRGERRQTWNNGYRIVPSKVRGDGIVYVYYEDGQPSLIKQGGPTYRMGGRYFRTLQDAGYAVEFGLRPDRHYWWVTVKGMPEKEGER